MCEVCGYAKCPAGCPNAKPTISCLCWNCGEEIYVGDTVYNINGEIWCQHCIDECEKEAEDPNDE